jgi:hypothetical protein
MAWKLQATRTKHWKLKFKNFSIKQKVLVDLINYLLLNTRSLELLQVSRAKRFFSCKRNDKETFQMSIIEKIKDIEAEMAKTQKNKATSYHLGTLKAKLAKLRRELITPSGGGGGPGIGFDVAKTGSARVGFIGFPSVGKSTLMSKLTGTHSEIGGTEFLKISV